MSDSDPELVKFAPGLAAFTLPCGCTITFALSAGAPIGPKDWTLQSCEGHKAREIAVENVRSGYELRGLR